MGEKNMENSRTQNSIRNIIFGAFNRFTSILFPFIIRTIFIKVLGEEYLGINSLFSSILQVLNLADLGFASAIIASMYKPIAENDVTTVSALLNLYRKIYKVIGGSIFVLGLILTPFIKIFINGTPPEEVNIYVLWLLYLTNTVVSYLFFAYKVSLLNALQRNDIVEKIGAVTRSFTSILQIVIVLTCKNIIIYVLLNVICSILYNVWCCIVCDKKYPQYVCKGTLNKEIEKTIYKNIGALAIQKIGSTVSLSLDAIIISAFLGLTTVAIYGNYYYIISAITSFVALVYAAITASIGNSIAIETPEKNYIDFKKMFFLNTWLIGWCCICFMCIFQDFMIVWMGKDLLFGMDIVFTLVLRFFFEQVRKIVLTYKDAAGMWYLDKWRPLVGCIVNLILNIALVKNVGVAGVAISTIVSYALVELPWETHVLFKHYFHKSEKEYYKIACCVIAKLGIAGIITYWMCRMVPFSGICAVIVKTGMCITIPNVMFIALNIYNKDFKNGSELVIRIGTILMKKFKKASKLSN